MSDWIKSCLLNPRWIVSLAPILLFSLIAAAAYAVIVACGLVGAACTAVIDLIHKQIVHRLANWTHGSRDD